MRRSRAQARASADPELRAVLPSIPAGGLTTLLVVAAAAPYLGSTWNGENREAIALLCLLGGLSSIGVLLLPRERLLCSRFRNHFFFLWSFLDAALIVAVASLDGGVGSPFTVLLFLTQAFSAVFYPFRLVVVCAAVNLLALLAIATLGAEGYLQETWFIGSALIGTALLCTLQARNANQQRLELALASRSDPLTGSLNRRGFSERLEEEVARSARSSAPFVLVVLDIDDFKRVNDQHGHAAGDLLLRAIVGALAGVVRGMDSIGRLGGDEFALLFPDTGCELIAGLERRVELAVGPHAPCSLGAACLPDHAATGAELLLWADHEMYRRKRDAAGLEVELQVVAEDSSRTTSSANLSSRSPL